MSFRLASFFKVLEPWVVAAFGVTGIAAASSISSACARTPAQAMEAARSLTPLEVSPQGSGYRVTAVRLDPLLHQRWATISSCDHPERPSIALLMPVLGGDGGFPQADRSANDQKSQAPFPAVHAGDLVRLWS